MRFNINTHIIPGKLYQIKIPLYIHPWADKKSRFTGSPSRADLIELKEDDIIFILSVTYTANNFFIQMLHKEDLEGHDVSLEIISKHGQNYIERIMPTSLNHDSILSLKEYSNG